MIKVLYDDERGVKEYENIDEMIFENLLEHKLDFIKISNTYVRTLEIEKENNTKQLAIVDIPLIETLTDDKRNAKYRKDYIARYLKKYNRCDCLLGHDEITYLLDYIQQKENIIKEVREYIEGQFSYETCKKHYITPEGKQLLEILDKVDKGDEK